MSTKVKVKCISKKESQNWDQKNPIATAIELEVPYDQNSIYWKLSGGTNLTLNTVNKDAADMSVMGSSPFSILEYWLASIPASIAYLRLNTPGKSSNLLELKRLPIALSSRSAMLIKYLEKLFLIIWNLE